MEFPSELKYTKSHEWVKSESDTCVSVGISEYAQGEISDVVFVELPEEGKVVSAGDVLCVVESVKAAFDIYSPVSGTVTLVNEALEDAPEKVNADCYGAGWFCKIELSTPVEVDSLLNSTAYAAQVG